MAKKLTTEEFIKRAREVHGEKYDYSLVEYKSLREKVHIICPEHGVFEQTPYYHLRGKICFKCGVKKRADSQSLTQKDFILKAQKIHQNKYNYELTYYKNWRTKIKIICPEHDIFEQIAGNHLKGQGCPKCKSKKISYLKSKPFKNFVKEAENIHYKKYKYIKEDYRGAVYPISIICPEHGIFKQTPDNHLQGHGCPKCAYELTAEKQKCSLEDFIKKANEIHQNKYNYSLVEYKNTKTEIIILCPEHGEFKQLPTNHLKGSGCPSCTKTGFNPNKPAVLYYIKDTETGFYKIGVTNKTVQERFGNQSRIKVVKTWEYAAGAEALKAEQEILNSFNYARVLNESWEENLGGKTEFFNRDVLLLDKGTKWLKN